MEAAQRRLGRVLRVTVIALLALCLAAAPATAQRSVFVDPAHDVVRQSKEGQKAAPHRRAVDIREATIRHGRDRIAIALHVRDLKVRRFWMSASMYHKRTKQAAVYPYIEVEWHPKLPHRADVYIEWDLPNCVEGPGTDKGGDRIRLHTNYRKNDIHLSFPRRCIGSLPEPRWVRARISMYTWSTKTDKLYVDDVSYPGTYPPSDTTDPVSPRVYAAKE